MPPTTPAAVSGERSVGWRRSSRAVASRQVAKPSSSSIRRCGASPLAAPGEGEDGGEGEAQAPAPVLAFGGRAWNTGAQPPSGGVESGEEAVVLVGEVLVEGWPRDAGPFDHVLNVGFPVAAGRRRVEHRGDQPLALDRPHQLDRSLAGSRREPALRCRQQLDRRVDLLGWPIVPDRLDEEFRLSWTRSGGTWKLTGFY